MIYLIIIMQFTPYIKDLYYTIHLQFLSFLLKKFFDIVQFLLQTMFVVSHVIYICNIY